MSFIKNYCEYAEEFTDAPKVIHHRVAMSLISTCLNRKVYLVQGAKRLYPCLWTLIIAGSSFYRKSSSIWIGEDILRAVDKKYLFPKEFSREKFIKDMAEIQSKGLLVMYEFKTFMGMLSRDYMAGTQSFLTEIYDCPPDYDRRTGANDLKVIEPFINILSASTVDWLVSSIKDEDMAGGFLPRFLIVTSPPKEKIIAFQPEAHQGKRDLLIQTLDKINHIEGLMTFSKEAIQVYTDWYVEFEKKCNTLPKNLSPFYARLTDYAKKFAMIFSIDRQLDELDVMNQNGNYWLRHDVSASDCRTACNLSEGYAEEITGLIANEISFNYYDKELKKIEKIFRASKGKRISRMELCQESRIRKKMLDEVLDHLIESDFIEKEVVKKEDPSGLKTVTFYWWKNGSKPDLHK